MKFVEHRVNGFYKFKLDDGDEMLKDRDVVTLEGMRYMVTGTFYLARTGKSGICVLELIL